jgi:hypothetical protein
MSVEPHERPEFANATEFTVKLTYVVAGGKRHGTSRRRAWTVASRLADAAARASGVIDVAAVGGPSHDGEILWADPVRFSRANCGTEGPDRLLDRYLGPDNVDPPSAPATPARTARLASPRPPEDAHRLAPGCEAPRPIRRRAGRRGW